MLRKVVLQKTEFSYFFQIFIQPNLSLLNSNDTLLGHEQAINQPQSIFPLFKLF